jgi:hypothetical protein
MSATQQALLAGSAAAGSIAGDILAALKSWWSMDENAASPTFADSHGSNDMTLRTAGSTTNTSVVSSATAIQGQAANLARVDDRCAYIPRSNTALDMTDTDFSFGGWFRIDQDSSTAAFIMGRVGDGAQIQAYLNLDSAGGLRAGATTDGSTVTSTATFGGWSATVYALIVLVFDRTNNQLGIRWKPVGGSVATSFVAFASALYTTSTTANFTISEGLKSDSTFFASNRSAVHYADECFFVDKALTADEFDYLFNAGTGKSYADLVADAS